MQSVSQKLENIIQSKYTDGDPGHDLSHLRRVVATCERIGKELGAKMDVLIPAAYLHDVINVPKNHPDRALASLQASQEAATILRGLDYSEDQVRAIAQAIIEHSFSAGHAPSSLEAAILQDADRLDAVGAIGLMRLISCGTRMGSVFYNDEEPVAHQRALDDRKFMLDHLDVKLFKIPERLNTAPAKKEAERRIRFLREFVSELQAEIAT